MNSLAARIGISNTWAILNEITSEELASRSEAELNKKYIAVAGWICYDADIFETCMEGHPAYSRGAAEDMEKLFDTLLEEGSFPGAKG